MSFKPWADGPLKLMETPSKTQDIKAHGSIYVANEMANAHNAMIRGINAIYLQAPNVKEPQDIKDLLFLTKTWGRWISAHHDLEEKQMFPGFEKVAGKPGLLQVNIEQHESFIGGLKELIDYASTTLPENYSGQKLQSIVDEFSEAFSIHFHEEIDTLLSLREYDSQGLLDVYKESVRLASGDVSPFELLPMFMGLRDNTFQDNTKWPEMPWIASYAVNWIFAWRYRGAWRFLPSDVNGNPRPLPFA